MTQHEEAVDIFMIEPVFEEKDLDILEDKTATFKGITFRFSSEYLAQLKKRLKEPHAVQLIVKTNDGMFAGYVAASEHLFPDYLHLVELFIDPSFSGRGLGLKLVDRIKEDAQKFGLKGVITQTEQENIPAQRLYEKFGFERVNNPGWQGITYRIIFDHPI